MSARVPGRTLELGSGLGPILGWTLDGGNTLWSRFVQALDCMGAPASIPGGTLERMSARIPGWTLELGSGLGPTRGRTLERVGISRARVPRKGF
nr:MAG: hypothetical protein DIU78_21550 [Pseudomonadota bacterium]